VDPTCQQLIVFNPLLPTVPLPILPPDPHPPLSLPHRCRRPHWTRVRSSATRMETRERASGAAPERGSGRAVRPPPRSRAVIVVARSRGWAGGCARFGPVEAQWMSPSAGSVAAGRSAADPIRCRGRSVVGPHPRKKHPCTRRRASHWRLAG
jgi:hypothetical protein